VVLNISLFDWNCIRGSLPVSGINHTNNTGANMDAFDVWNSNGFFALVLAAPKHRSWFYGFEIMPRSCLQFNDCHYEEIPWVK